MNEHGAYTPKQLEIMRYIVTFRNEHKYSPTLTEMAEALEISHTAVHARVHRLMTRGAIDKVGPGGRSWIVVDIDAVPEANIDDVLRENRRLKQEVQELTRRLDQLLKRMLDQEAKGGQDENN